MLPLQSGENSSESMFRIKLYYNVALKCKKWSVFLQTQVAA